jgi:hypothetical protein
MSGLAKLFLLICVLALAYHFYGDKKPATGTDAGATYNAVKETPRTPDPERLANNKDPFVDDLGKPYLTLGRGGATNFTDMVEEIGCKSKYSDEKKGDIFAAKYKDRDMIVSGTIETLSKDSAGLKILPTTRTFDATVKFEDPNAGYDLEKGQRLLVRLMVRDHGGCFLPFGGDRGVILK